MTVHRDSSWRTPRPLPQPALPRHEPRAISGADRQGRRRCRGRNRYRGRAQGQSRRDGIEVQPARRQTPRCPSRKPLPLDIVYEDDDLIVIDKPAGLVVHPAAGHSTGTLVNALLAHCGASLSGIGGVRRPGIVHRLDKDTSGLHGGGQDRSRPRGLSQQFAAHGRDGRLERAYLAFVWGRPAAPNGHDRCADRPQARSTGRRWRSSRRAPAGRRSPTMNCSRARSARRRWRASLRCRLETGRTHQIRVHMAHIGHPLLGDDTYGKGFSAQPTKLPRSRRGQR